MKSHISVDKLIDNSAVIRKSMINVLAHRLPKGEIANSLFTLYMLSSFVRTPDVSEKSFSFSLSLIFRLRLRLHVRGPLSLQLMTSLCPGL